MPAETPTPTLAAFVGRQPIFDRKQAVHGYELLFRMDPAAQPGQLDGTVITAQVVLNTFLEFGLDAVVGPHLAFVNATRDFIVGGYARHLPHDRIVIEVLEDVPPDADVLAALVDLRRAGYQVALDDFVFREELRPLLPLADLIKVDISILSRDDLEQQVKMLKDLGIRLLAERVETREEFELCQGMGFELFQGYFLAKPTVVKGQRRAGNQLTTLRLLALLEDPKARLDAVEEAISLDPTLSYKLLKVVNSAAFAMSRNIESLRQALLLLGLGRIHSWATLLALAGLSNKPPELLASALTRAKMAELLGQQAMSDQAASCFTVGLFSALDAMLDQPMADIVASVPLSEAVKAALVRGEGPLGGLLGDVLHYERCEWDRIRPDVFTPAQLRSAYLAAVDWSGHLVGEGLESVA